MMESIGDKILFGLATAALGLIVVFAGLLLIIVMIKIVGAVARAIDNKGKAKEALKAQETAAIETPKEEAVSDDLQLVAAISAAVACMLDTDVSNIRIKSIRKANGSAWARASRKEQIYNNF